MYNLPHFKASNQKEIMDFVNENPFITLCGVTADLKPACTHVPVLIDVREDKIFLQAHIMRNQDHTKAFMQNPNVLAIFSSQNHYVSASWYKDKMSGSTWNYQAVHMSGTMHFMDEEFLFRFLGRLTERFEQNPNSPSLVSKLDKSYVIEMMKAIVAFEIEVTNVQHVFKLSQNKDKESYEAIASKLENSDAAGKIISEKMKRRMNQVFSHEKSDD